MALFNLLSLCVGCLESPYFIFLYFIFPRIFSNKISKLFFFWCLGELNLFTAPLATWVLGVKWKKNGVVSLTNEKRKKKKKKSKFFYHLIWIDKILNPPPFLFPSNFTKSVEKQNGFIKNFWPSPILTLSRLPNKR